jgi:hypothetical protein
MMHKHVYLLLEATIMQMLTKLIQAFEAAPYTSHGTKLLSQAVAKRPESGLVLEFGVATGYSLRHLLNEVPGHVHGFDSFLGLPEQWNKENPKGAFNMDGQPPSLFIDHSRATLHIGLFEDTLPKFFQEHTESVAFAHVDCDLYSSTKTVLGAIRDRIQPGTILLFDEFWNYPGQEQHEALAFAEFLAETNLGWECLGRAKDTYSSAAFRILQDG